MIDYSQMCRRTAGSTYVSGGRLFAARAPDGETFHNSLVCSKEVGNVRICLDDE